MRNELIHAGGIAIGSTALLGILFGTSGAIIAIFASAVSAPAYYALRRFGAEEHAALAACLPLGLIASATLTYPLSFLVGIRLGALISAGLLIASALILGSKNLKKRRAHRSV